MRPGTGADGGLGLGAEGFDGRRLCVPGTSPPYLMPGMAPRYPEGSTGVWASPKPRDGADLLPTGVPTVRRQRGFPISLLPCHRDGSPHPRNGSLGIQADGRLHPGCGQLCQGEDLRVPGKAGGPGGRASLKEGRARCWGGQLGLGDRCL